MNTWKEVQQQVWVHCKDRNKFLTILGDGNCQGAAGKEKESLAEMHCKGQFCKLLQKVSLR